MNSRQNYCLQGFGDEFGDGFGDGLGDGGMIPEFQQERHATIEPLVPQPMETQPFVLEAPSCEQQPVVPEAEEEMPEVLVYFHSS